MTELECDRFSVKLSDEGDDLQHRLRNEKDIRNIALIALEIFNLDKKYQLRCEAKRYSEKDGSVAETAWEPFEKWDGNLWIDYSMNGAAVYEGQPAFGTLVMNTIPDALAVSIVETKGEGWHGTVVSIEHIARHNVGSYERGGTIPAHFKFKKLPNIIIEE